MTYQFSDTELAALRLSYLAGVFEPTTRSFLAESAAHRQGICLDLGCGLGHTTHHNQRSRRLRCIGPVSG